jgi:MFS transporter, DHA1 family, multidrug resistance protein
MTSRAPLVGLPGWLLVIAVMNGIGPVSIDLYLPAFNMIEAEFGETGVARTMASYLLGITVGQLFYGPISDHFGRKPPLYVGFVIYTIGSLGCAFATNMNMLMLSRVVQALGASSGMVIGRAIVRDRCEPEQAARAFSLLMTIVSVAPILAPIAGGFIVSAFGWRAGFVLQASLGIAILLAVHFFVSESLPAKRTQPLNLRGVLQTYRRLLGHSTFIAYSFIAGFAWSALFSYVAGAPTILPALYDVSPQTLGWLIGMNGIAFMIASRLNLRALRRIGAEAILARYVWQPSFVALTLLAVAVIAYLGYLVPLFVVLALQFSFFVTTARIPPNVSALALAPYAKDAGSASAVMGAVQSVTPMIAGMTIALTNNGTLLPLAIIMSVSMIVCGLLHRWASK